jgi:hypothetical protein
VAVYPLSPGPLAPAPGRLFGPMAVAALFELPSSVTPALARPWDVDRKPRPMTVCQATRAKSAIEALLPKFANL